jgi:hypothetical protein
MPLMEQILEKKAKAVWKIVKKETGKCSAEEETKSVNIND